MSDKTAPPVRHHRHGVLKAIRAQALGAKEPEERTQRRRHQLQRPWLIATRCRADERNDVSSAEFLDLHASVREALFQERPDPAGVIGAGAYTDTPGSPQMVIEGGQRRFDSPS